MELREIANIIGMETYPEKLEEIYEKQLFGAEPACDLMLIDSLQQELNLFGTYYSLVRETAQEINADEAYATWVKVTAVYISDESWGSVADLPVPDVVGPAKRDLLMLYPMLPLIPKAVERYRKQGFCEEEILQYMATFRNDIAVVEKQTGRPGLNLVYFRWTYRFATASIFKVFGIQFEKTRLKQAAVYLKHKQSGEIIPLITNGLYHASGRAKVGSAGYEDCEHAFEVSFGEDEENFYGHGAFDTVVEREKRTYPKRQWECVGRPGDKCFGMHLPRNCDITEENVKKACNAAMEIAKREFPEYYGAPIQCTSWLLDPTLEKLMGEESNIVKFGKLYARYSVKGNGQAVFGFVFPAKYEDYEFLPENTRLERALKQRYLNGGYMYLYSGIMR